MDDLNVAQTLLGGGGAVVLVGLVELCKRTTAGLVADAWWDRLIPTLTLALAAGWNLIVANTLASLGQPVTFNGWILGYLTVLAALSAMGLYSGAKSVTRASARQGE